jgi:hypothetical protein
MVNWNSDGDSPRSSADMASRGRLGGLTTSMLHDTRETTRRAREAFMARFYEGIPHELPGEERERRAVAAMRLHMGQLGRKSGKARRKVGRP